MDVSITGGTGFLGAHVTRMLSQRGDNVRVAYRNPDRLKALAGVSYRRAKADVLDYPAMRRAVRGSEVLFHTVGFVGSNPAETVWRINAYAPVIAVEAAAAEGVRRVVLTSTISAIGLSPNGTPADENTEYPKDWLGLAYPDSKHEGERAAIETGGRHGVEVVVVNPAYLLRTPVDRSQPGETSTRTVGNYLRGRLPGVIDAGMNFADVQDAAAGHLLACEHGKPGERYILGAANLTWPELIDCVAEVSGIHHTILVMPREVARLARIRDAVGVPGAMSVEGYELMGKDWRFTSEKAKRELGYRPRPIEKTIRETVQWYLELMQDGAFDDEDGRSGLSTMASVTRTASQLGLLLPLRLGMGLLGRRVIAGG